MKKKILSAVLALCLVFGGAASLPHGAFDEISNASVSAVEANTETSGKCGENVTWTLKDGVLTISGNGSIYDYDLGQYIFNRSDIESVIIKHGVTSIGEGAFFGCPASTFEIADSVTRIGDGAFHMCYCLKEISIPNSVTSIGASAFSFSGNLSSVSIPSSVKSIGDYAFYYCGMKSVTIPNTVTSIGTNAFGYTGEELRKINDFVICGKMDSAAEKYANDNGFLFIPSDSVTRFKGSGRYATAAAISQGAYPETADTVVLANGTKFADALAGATLANAYEAPILLTEAGRLPDETLAEIERLGAKNVIILGGSASVGQAVKDTLKKNGLDFDIVKGKSKYATAVEIAKATKTVTKADPTEIFFVSADKFADALSVSAVAAKKNAPIIYLPKTGSLDADTAAYLKSVKGKIKNAYVIGGSGVIGADVMTAAGKALGLTVDKNIVRVKGKTKYDTCVEVNTKFADVLNGKAICVATGEDFPDALAGGVYAAKESAPLFLVNGKASTPVLSDGQKTYLKTKATEKIAVFGGSGVVPNSHIGEIAENSL